MRQVLMGMLVLVLVAASLGWCTVAGVQVKAITGSGKLEGRGYDLRGFTKVEAGNGCKLEVTAAEGFSVSLEMDDNLEEYLEVTVTGATLHIRTKPGLALALNNVTRRATLTLPELTGLDLSGGTRGQVSGFRSEKNLDVTLSGGSQLYGDVSSGHARLNLSGGSLMEVTGAAGNLDINASGGSRARLAGWSVQDVKIDARGGSQVAVNLSSRLSGEASGGSRVQYSGNPTSVDVEESGGSRVEKQ
jgi:hypothetical protein